MVKLASDNDGRFPQEIIELAVCASHNVFVVVIEFVRCSFSRQVKVIKLKITLALVEPSGTMHAVRIAFS